MAWNLLTDVARYCKLCNQYRVFAPFDPREKHKALDGLSQMHNFFGGQSIQERETKEKTANSFLANKKNAQLCMNLITTCQKCDRTKPQVRKNMALLR